jgi:hypothetical protein
VSEHLSDLTLDRLLAGELDGAPAGESARAHLAACEACETRRAEIVRDAEAFPQGVWIAGEAAKVRKKLDATKRRFTPMAGVAALAAAAAIAAVAIGLRPPATDLTTIKGDRVGLVLYAKRANGSVARLEEGAVLSAGDAVRFEVTTRSAGSLTIAGVDGAGKVSTYFQIDLSQPVAGEILEGSVVLDDAPIAERFFAILCENGASPALPTLGADPRQATALGSGCREGSFLIRKK